MNEVILEDSVIEKGVKVENCDKRINFVTQNVQKEGEQNVEKNAEIHDGKKISEGKELSSSKETRSKSSFRSEDETCSEEEKKPLALKPSKT